MADNVTQQLGSSRPALLERLSENTDLCNVVMGLLSRCIILSQERGVPIEGIDISEVAAQETDNGDLTMRAKVTFHAMAMTNAAMWPLQSDFARYVRAKAYGLGLALQKNPKIAVFFQSLVEHVDNYCLHKQMQFGAVVVKQSIISNPGDMLVLKVGRKILDA